MSNTEDFNNRLSSETFDLMDEWREEDEKYVDITKIYPKLKTGSLVVSPGLFPYTVSEPDYSSNLRRCTTTWSTSKDDMHMNKETEILEEYKKNEKIGLYKKYIINNDTKKIIFRERDKEMRSPKFIRNEFGQWFDEEGNIYNEIDEKYKKIQVRSRI